MDIRHVMDQMEIPCDKWEVVNGNFEMYTATLGDPKDTILTEISEVASPLPQPR